MELRVSRNEAAVERAKELSSLHGIKAVAYKVNGRLVHIKQICTYHLYTCSLKRCPDPGDNRPRGL